MKNILFHPYYILFFGNSQVFFLKKRLFLKKIFDALKLRSGGKRVFHTVGNESKK